MLFVAEVILVNEYSIALKKDDAVAFSKGEFHETVSFYHRARRDFNRLYLFFSAAGVADGFKDHCKI